MTINIPVDVSFDSVADILVDLDKLQTYKLYEGSNELLVTKEDVADVLTRHLVVQEKREPHWIPVTKDTPKEAGTYMCTCYDAGRRIVTLAKWQPRTKTWNLTGARAYWKVIAWCKCPEPYKGVTE